MYKHSFIIAEPNYLIRRGLVACLHELTNAEILKEADDPATLRKSLQRTEADFLIINPGFCEPQSQGQSLRQLLQTEKPIRVIGFYPDANSAGALGLKTETSLFWTDSKSAMAEKLAPLFGQAEEDDEDLTQREKDIVRSIALGLTNKEIGDKLFISPHTVITHRKNITRKLGIKSVSGITVYAILNNLISVDEVND